MQVNNIKNKNNDILEYYNKNNDIVLRNGQLVISLKQQTQSQVQKNSRLTMIMKKYANTGYNVLVLYGCNLFTSDLLYIIKQGNNNRNNQQQDQENKQNVSKSIKNIVEWNKLLHLNLGANRLNKQSLKILIQVQMPQLQKLNISSNPICNNGLKYLCSYSNWSSLKYLNISFIKITSVISIAQSYWPCLLSITAEQKQHININQFIASCVKIGCYYMNEHKIRLCIVVSRKNMSYFNELFKGYVVQCRMR